MVYSMSGVDVMSLNRRAAKRDDSEGGIVATWDAMGAHSEAISGKGLPDRLVFWTNTTFPVETKSGKRGLTKAQVKKFSELYLKGVSVWVVRTPEEARRVLTGLHPPWKPSDGARAGATKKERSHRPGYDRARDVLEQCGVTFCGTSKLKGKRYCAEHKGKP